MKRIIILLCKSDKAIERVRKWIQRHKEELKYYYWLQRNGKYKGIILDREDYTKIPKKWYFSEQTTKYEDIEIFELLEESLFVNLIEKIENLQEEAKDILLGTF